MILRAPFGLLLAATLAGCGTVDQAPPDREVAAAVHEGMSVDAALRSLQRQGFASVAAGAVARPPAVGMACIGTP